MVRAVFIIVETNNNATTSFQAGPMTWAATMMRRAPLLCGVVIMMTRRTYTLTLKLQSAHAVAFTGHPASFLSSFLPSFLSFFLSFYHGFPFPRPSC
jgi:hypothetical protein